MGQYNHRSGGFFMDKKFIIRKKNGTYNLPFEEVVYMEKDLRKIKVHTQLEGFECIDFYGRFEDIYDYLDERFMFCNRSFVFNMDKIVIMADSQVLLEGNIRVHLGRDSFSRGKKQLNEFIKKKYQKNK